MFCSRCGWGWGIRQDSTECLNPILKVAYSVVDRWLCITNWNWSQFLWKLACTMDASISQYSIDSLCFSNDQATRRRDTACRLKIEPIEPHHLVLFAEIHRLGCNMTVGPRVGTWAWSQAKSQVAKKTGEIGKVESMRDKRWTTWSWGDVFLVPGPWPSFLEIKVKGEGPFWMLQFSPLGCVPPSLPR